MKDPEFLVRALEKRQNQNSIRKLADFQLDSIDFCSNDFLGFGRSQEIRNKISFALSNNKTDPFIPASRLIAGNHCLYTELETNLPAFHHAPSGLIFNSGYSANLSILSSIPQKGDTIVYDEQIHASARDGIRLSWAKSFSFKHNNLNDLEKKIKIAKGKIFVVVEGIYSMDGDSPNFKALAQLAHTYNCYLIVDEAHSNGIVGHKGKGICVEHGIEDQVFIRIMTFGKAMGANGAIVLGSETMVDYLINFSRPFIYTTALTPESLLRIKISYESLAQFNFDYLHQLNKYFSDKFSEFSKFQLLGTSLIKSIIIPGNEKVSYVAEHLRNKGFNVREIRSPTVPSGTERLRICLHHYNKLSEIDLLFDELTKMPE